MNQIIKQNKIFSSIKKALDQNAPTIATFGSLVGVGLTLYFSYKAAKASSAAQVQYEENLEALEDEIDEQDMTEEYAKSEKNQLRISHALQMVYIYRWALVSGSAACALAILSNHLNGRTIAGITSLLALNQDKLKKGAEKVKELVGEEKFQSLQEDLNREIFSERFKKGKLETETIDIPVAEDVVFGDHDCVYDTYWGNIIEIPENLLKDAIDQAEKQEYLNWNDWRGMLGLESCLGGYAVEWEHKNPFKAHISWIDIGAGGMKCIMYDNQPTVSKMSK